MAHSQQFFANIKRVAWLRKQDLYDFFDISNNQFKFFFLQRAKEFNFGYGIIVII